MTTEKAPKITAPPTKVLHLIDTGGPGGAEMVLDTIVRNLDAERWQSRVVVPTEDWLFSRLSAQDADTVVLPTDRAADVRYLRRLTDEIRAYGPSVIHAHLLGSGVYGSLAAALTGGLPLVCTFHGRPDVSPSDRLLRLKARILSRSRNRIAYVSHDLRSYLEPLLGVPEHLGVVVHNGIEFTDPLPRGTERADCGAGPGDLLVGAVGNVRPAKDFGTLLEAAALVRAQRPNVRFAIAGDQRSPLMEPLTRQVERLGLQEHVRFLGFRNDAAALMSSFDLVVSSSHTEGLPLGIVEAVGLGTPVVLTSVGGVPEVVESGRTGILVPPRNPAALAAGILEALAHPERGRTMADAGSRDVRARFNARRMCDDYQELYSALMRA